MKSRLTICLLFICSIIYAQQVSQENDVFIENSDIKINTYSPNKINTIVIQLNIGFKGIFNDYEIIPGTFKDLNSEFKVVLKSKKFNALIKDVKFDKVFTRKNFIQIDLSNISNELIQKFKSSESDFYITANNNIKLKIWKKDTLTTVQDIEINKIQIEEKTKQDSLTLTDTMIQEYINSKGGEIVMTQNKLDFGVIPVENSSSTNVEVNASFSYRKRYSFLSSKIPVFFTAEGLISTNAKDSLNFLSVYPVNYNFSKGTNQFIGQLGFEGNQTFSNYRVTANFFWNGIIPNLVDLTFGENRLRLKPVVKLGAKFYKEVANNRPVQINSKEFSNQAFGEIYYYIPIHNVYSLIIEGRAFYDFNKSLNVEGNLKSNYSITFGLEVPKTKMKTIFKYTKGVNGVTFEKNEYIVVGLLMDSFRIKK
tara:strand:- start:7122 stop:8390 length:1269 start_codon:yes stop_codon:yes gene_type:complete